jgi:hypothetical protein
MKTFRAALAALAVVFAPVTAAQAAPDTLPAWSRRLSLHPPHQHRTRQRDLFRAARRHDDADRRRRGRPEFAEIVKPLKAFPPVPDGEHSAAYWIADYIRQFAPTARPVKLDYALITHFHTDHMGTITPDKPMSKTGAYRLAGITELADLVPITTLVDRAAPPTTIRSTCESAPRQAACRAPTACRSPTISTSPTTGSSTARLWSG